MWTIGRSASWPPSGGVAAAWSDASPVGSRSIDVVLVFLAVGVVTWASASASWWAGASAAGIGALLAIDPLVTAIGAVGCVGGLWLGSQRRDLSIARAAVGGVGRERVVPDGIRVVRRGECAGRRRFGGDCWSSSACCVVTASCGDGRRGSGWCRRAGCAGGDRCRCRRFECAFRCVRRSPNGRRGYRSAARW